MSIFCHFVLSVLKMRIPIIMLLSERSSEKSFSDDLNFIAARQDCLTSDPHRASFVCIAQTRFDNRPTVSQRKTSVAEDARPRAVRLARLCLPSRHMSSENGEGQRKVVAWQ
ncbi:hypothetical protein NEISICOT_00847 [Neisseria sicca ATCC 29256]|uniref:Uncharacterized protein n=1 Tax=Neisseria sicca ATCC 29256 TaxID=547045 RepID=C6M2V7_NEISI|nr:hypothetical protein NEISICOT_00847 [Neisseria sicca ATCC 29256]